MLFSGLKKMFNNKATNLLNVPKALVQQWLNTFDTVLTDCDGVLWHEDTAIEGVPQAVSALMERGKRVYFITNNGTLTHQQLHQRATKLGYQIEATDIIAPAYSIAQYLKAHNFQQRVYIIGGAAIAEELSAVGIEHFGVGPDVMTGRLGEYITREVVGSMEQSHEVGAVVVAFDEHFSYGKMMKACNYLCHNPRCLFLTTNSDPVHRYPQYVIPGTGALLRALEVCADREAVQFGKPNPTVCETLVQSGAVVPQRTLMIGDSCKIDIAFGHNCGFQTLLACTGSNTKHELETLLQQPDSNQHYIPDVYLPSLSDISKFL